MGFFSFCDKIMCCCEFLMDPMGTIIGLIQGKAEDKVQEKVEAVGSKVMDKLSAYAPPDSVSFGATIGAPDSKEQRATLKEIRKKLKDSQASAGYVKMVYKNMTAEKMGLKIGDYIVAVDDNPFYGDEYGAALKNALMFKNAGSTLTIKVYRKNKFVTLKTELAQSHSPF